MRPHQCRREILHQMRNPTLCFITRNFQTRDIERHCTSCVCYSTDVRYTGTEISAVSRARPKTPFLCNRRCHSNFSSNAFRYKKVGAHCRCGSCCCARWCCSVPATDEVSTTGGRAHGKPISYVNGTWGHPCSRTNHFRHEKCAARCAGELENFCRGTLCP